MRLRVINLVDSLARVNYGIWNAAVNTAPVLAQNHDIVSELWFPEATVDSEVEIPEHVTVRRLANTTIKTLKATAEEAGLDPATDIIVTHGAWRYPTKWGAWLRGHGFRWVYVPHGMLEPWSMQQKALVKSVYYRFIEGPQTRRAAGVRAVGQPERKNLLQRYSSVVFIPNGHSARATNFVRPQEPVQFLYLARLHSKKRPAQMAAAWLSSPLAQDPHFRLVIAGPDEGEGAAIRKQLASKPSGNLILSDGIYGREKEQLLRQSHFFLLPSLSEGFPTAVVEAMSEGLIPLISMGCNFPDAFAEGLAINTGTEVDTIRRAIEEAASLPPDRRTDWQNRCRQFAVSHYSLEVVARHQAFWYSALLGLHAAQPRAERSTDELDAHLDEPTPISPPTDEFQDL